VHGYTGTIGANSQGELKRERLRPCKPENYLCSLTEVGINRYLIYAMDVESHQEFQSRGWQSYFNPKLTETLNITKTTKDATTGRPDDVRSLTTHHTRCLLCLIKVEGVIRGSLDGH
jgi:hypothetical protein